MNKKTLFAANVEIRKGQMITGKTARPGAIPVIAGGKSPAYYHDKANRFAHTITISGSGASAGYLAFHELPIYASDCSTIEAGEGYDLKYLYYALLAKQAEIYAAQTGGAQPHIHPKDLAPIECNFPPLAEQQKIAAVLSDIDALIETQEALIAKKKDVKTATMELLLTGRKRLPGSGRWITKKLSQLANLYQPQTIGSKMFTSQGHPVYGANGKIGLFNRYNHDAWQVVISCRGNCGSVNKTEPFSWINGNAMVVNFDENANVDKLFFYHALSHVDFSGLVTGSGQPQIVREPLNNLAIYFPESLSEQKKLAGIFADLDQLLEMEIDILLKIRQQKDAVMHNLLAGEIRLP